MTAFWPKAVVAKNTICYKEIMKGFLLRSWWLYLVLFTGFLLYAHAMQKKDFVCNEMKKKELALREEKRRALEEKEELLLQIESQDDPRWIEMTLMKGLGLVPEGQVKVYFE